jgi:hypothetical protein
MPLDFNTTKNFRDKMLSRTLDPVYGRSPSPKTFTSTNYSVQNLGDSPNLLLPDVDDSRSNDLLIPQKSNIFKPAEYLVKESLQDLPRRANLSLYPYFVATENNLLGIMTTRNYDTESELFKFAANNIRTNPQGPVLARISQNLNTTINERNRIGEALGGNTTTLVNILRGKEPLIAGNPKITVPSSIVGQGIDFLGTVAGTQLPFSTIPGDYLTNPRNPINVRPTDVSTGTKVWQDLTGVLGSIVGIQRRPLPSRKPSDILIEHMGSSTKNRLFDLLSFSKYAPNYTTSARSQMSTTLGKFPSQVAQGFKSLFGMEAPNQGVYIGDDRENDVKQATTDLFSGRPVRSSFYLSRLFDPISAELFHNTKSIIENGPIGGNLTWISRNKTSTANLTNLQKTKSTDFKFRTDSILDITQQILDTKPQNGGDALAHIGHILDQTSRYFKDGDTLISRGSGVRYIDNSGKDIGVEYARVWTKDRPYLTYGNTMPLYKETTQKPYYKGGETPFRRTGIRRFDGSVMTNTWNLNIAPMSDGTKSDKFPGSSNILPNPNGKGFYAKKYMLSIENLAWGASTTPGFTVNDLPYSERGPNGGRVMWFPPYDLKVSEQNSAKWEPNTFLGRPEPIYTYQNTERNGSLSFKVIVDHPSILNLLIREHFKSVNETDADAYINAFFAGAKDIDFYSLIRQYPNLNSDDISMIQNYLNNSKDPAVINNLKNTTSGKVADNPGGTSTEDANKQNVTKKLDLIFPNDLPGNGDSNVSPSNYETSLLPINENDSQTKLNDALISVINGTSSGYTADRILLFGKDTITSSESGSTVNKIITDHQTTFSVNNTATTELINSLDTLKTDLKNKNVKGDVVILISSRTTKSGSEKGNYQLSVRRSHSIYQTILDKVNEAKFASRWDFKKLDSQSFPNGMEVYVYENQYTFKELGYEELAGNLIIRTTNYGYLANHEKLDCSKVGYNNSDLTKYTPLSYGCRSSSYSIEYSKSNKSDKPVNTSSLSQLTPAGRVSMNNTKPPTDLMKRIIMKTLSEEFYFKKLEETSPMIYSSLKEKLRYFHPGFHSMTPEGLNSRLTFLQQCLRPGDTIPVKGLSDNSDINARNTTFGPPPVCVLRVGDFYNSKVVIKDLNIQFEQNVWDLNPEGIGIQPMIADVTIQLSFLGGQGLEKPVERLQNALSSNFFANTEMYDERSISTNTKIGGQDANDFTKEFIQSLSDRINPPVVAKDTSVTPIKEGQYIGTLEPKEPTIDYTTTVNELFEKTNTYFTSYESFYNNVLTSNGSLLTNLIINRDYRKLNAYDVFTGDTSTAISLFGLYKDKTLPTYIDDLSKKLTTYIKDSNPSYLIDMFDLKNVVPDKYKTEINEFLTNNINNIIPTKLNEINELKSIKEFETKRNELIESLDKLNYITKNGSDVKTEKNKSTTIVLKTITPASGDFDKNKFYLNYNTAIDYINNNTTKMYEKLDTTFDFENIVITDNAVKNILNAILKDSTDDIVRGIGMVLSSEDYSTLDKLENKIKDKINKWFTKIKEENLKFAKPPIRKNSKPITYTMPPLDISEVETPTTDEIKWLFGEKHNVTDSLNYYRI